MADYEIVCASSMGAPPHRHIVGVGLGEATNTLTATQIRMLIDQGNTFYAVLSPTERRGAITKLDCPCGALTLGIDTTTAGSGTVERLRECPG